MAFLVPDDLTPFASIDETKAQAMIDDAEAMAVLAAPCITAEDFAYGDAVKAILRGAVLRWNETGTGAAQSTTAGPFGMTLDTRQERRGMFWPSELAQLRGLCADVGAGVYSVSLAGPDPDTDDPYWPIRELGWP